MSKLFKLQDISLTFQTKNCFEDFSADVFYGDKIAILGDNGSGKSSLLKIINGDLIPESGEIEGINNVSVQYVEQIPLIDKKRSGAEKFNDALSPALAEFPDVLLLDEPTNHLDSHNRNSLIRMLNSYPGIVIVATHDMDLIRDFANIFWHIVHGKIHVNNYGYDEFLKEQQIEREKIESQLQEFDKEKKSTHQQLMREQKRAKNSKKRGEKNIDNRKWPTIVSHAKARRAEETSGRKKKALGDRRKDLNEKLLSIRLPEEIVPKFTIIPKSVVNKMHVTVFNGAVGYEKPLLDNIIFTVAGNERLGIRGKNGSGKSTIVKAILDRKYRFNGQWDVTDSVNIGYLDQHYKNIDKEKTVLENLNAQGKTAQEIRSHLNDFLFRKNEEVNQKAEKLSGGELARLSLAQIAINTPELLILDEITNNLDLKTRNHVISVIKNFPGALIVISHDRDFLNAIGIDEFYDIV